MAIGIDEIDEIDDLDFEEETQEEELNDNEDQEESPYEEQEDEQEESGEELNSVVELLLVNNGVDPDNIKFENDFGEIESRPWGELSKEEQFNILSSFNQNNYNPETGLDDEEIELINQIRSNKMRPSEYINHLYESGAKRVQENLQPQHIYQVDDLTDEDIYILDLQSKVENITDEELADALELAKQNPDLFAKQTQALRAQYKNAEDEHIAMQEAEAEQQRQAAMQEYGNAIYNELSQFRNSGDLAINMSQEDTDEIMDFIMGQDGAGVNHFSKALNDPATVVRMAWFALKGDDVFDSISDYMSQLIKKVSRSQYQKGLEDGRKGVQPSRSSRVSVKKNYRDTREINSIDDID